MEISFFRCVHCPSKQNSLLCLAASRMESHGEVGEINISEETYLRIKDDPAFHFTPRAKMYVKDKGEMSMYFVRKTAPR